MKERSPLRVQTERPFYARKYTLGEIADAVRSAAMQAGTIKASTLVKDPMTYMRVEYAKNKARADTDFWKQPRDGSNRIGYDYEYATGILDMLSELSQNKNAAVKRRYQDLGITPEVVSRAEEILFGSES